MEVEVFGWAPCGGDERERGVKEEREGGCHPREE